MRLGDQHLALSAKEGARVVALGLLAEATEAAEALAAGTGREPLHDFRVAVRRLRSALRTYRPWLEGDVRRRHRKRLRRLASATNEARDAEVQLAWLAPRRAELASPSQVAGHRLVVARFEARLHRAPDTARVAGLFGRIGGQLRRRLERYERRATARGDLTSFDAALASLVGGHVERLAVRLDAIRDAADVGGVHRARIEGKRLRYLLEPLRGWPCADASDAVARLKTLQDLLGDLHDAHVLAAELGAALVDASAERARLVHEAALAPGGPASVRARLRESPRPGLVALVRLVRARRDALFARLELDWRGDGLAALLAPARAVAAGLDARASAPAASTTALARSTAARGRPGPATRRRRPP